MRVRWRTVKQAVDECHVESEELNDGFSEEEFEWSDYCFGEEVTPVTVFALERGMYAIVFLFWDSHLFF